ncbi:hypothetical protein Tsp_10245 [Trichinella spiralis]|uniref:hypothetical protein n=1 Tax=Trichinella spiralis TaxID=6334 RepID=UPI0001EFDFB2|nr:hypothetical protein Tsp_10245 [Trichinella spiralis]
MNVIRSIFDWDTVVAETSTPNGKIIAVVVRSDRPARVQFQNFVHIRFEWCHRSARNEQTVDLVEQIPVGVHIVAQKQWNNFRASRFQQVNIRRWQGRISEQTISVAGVYCQYACVKFSFSQLGTLSNNTDMIGSDRILTNHRHVALFNTADNISK